MAGQTIVRLVDRHRFKRVVPHLKALVPGQAIDDILAEAARVASRVVQHHCVDGSERAEVLKSLEGLSVADVIYAPPGGGDPIDDPIDDSQLWAVVDWYTFVDFKGRTGSNSTSSVLIEGPILRLMLDADPGLARLIATLEGEWLRFSEYSDRVLVLLDTDEVHWLSSALASLTTSEPLFVKATKSLIERSEEHDAYGLVIEQWL